MAERSIVNRSPLDSGNIDYGAFTASLIQESIRTGLLEQQDLERFQDGLLLLLKGQISKVTREESSSVSTEAADHLMDGIGYCIDLALKGCSTLDDSAALLKNKSTSELYEMGTDILTAHEKACEALLSRVRATRIDTVNEAYQLALDCSLPDMLHDWKCGPFPHGFAFLAEYPLAQGLVQDGLPGMHEYLAALALENRFCARFAGSIGQLLRDYARQNRVSPAEAYVNLFTAVLQNLLLCRLLELDGLELTPMDCAALQVRLTILSDEQRTKLIMHAANLLLESCAFENPNLEAYLLHAAERFASMLNRAQGHLEPFAVVTLDDPQMIHTDGEKLDDDAFSLVAEEIRLCENGTDKARIIREELRSLADLCDMLGAECIFEEEFDEVFASFDDATCALVLTKLPVETEQGAVILQDEDAKDWQIRYSDYLNLLEQDKLQQILKMYASFSK